ncbi:MAG: transcriptional regulator [Nitrososphaerales archaeon]
MTRKPNRSVGIVIFIACIVGFITYAWLLLVSEWSEAVLKLTVLAAVATLLGVLAWIGLTMTNTRTTTEQEQNVGKELGPEETQK